MYEENYRELANSIIKQAVSDYRSALRGTYKYSKNSSAYMLAKKEQREIERFFHSWWFSQLTELNGELLIRKLKKEAEERWGHSI